MASRANGLSLAAQLNWRLRRLLGSGQLAPGDRLPSARELAAAVGVNPNTVFAVYSELERQGLIESRQGSGSFVLPGAERAAELIALADETAALARAAGLDPRDLAMSVFVTPDQPSAGRPSSAAQADRKRLRVEIAALERELAGLQPLRSAPAGEAPPAPRLQSSDELRATRDALLARVNELSADRRQLIEQAREQRASAHSSTLDRPSRSAGDPGASTPLPVRWTPAWRMG